MQKTRWLHENFCELMHEAFKPQNIIAEDEFEETIRRIDYYSILIMSFGYQGKIDLNQLKSYDAVVSIGLYPSTGSLPSSIQNYKKVQWSLRNIQIDSSRNNILKIHNAILSQMKSTKAFWNYYNQRILELSGNIKDKVGYLHVTSGTTKIIDSPLNSNCAIFLLCSIAKDSQPIQSKFLLSIWQLFNH